MENAVSAQIEHDYYYNTSEDFINNEPLILSHNWLTNLVNRQDGGEPVLNPIIEWNTDLNFVQFNPNPTFSDHISGYYKWDFFGINVEEPAMIPISGCEEINTLIMRPRFNVSRSVEPKILAGDTTQQIITVTFQLEEELPVEMNSFWIDIGGPNIAYLGTDLVENEFVEQNDVIGWTESNNLFTCQWNIYPKNIEIGKTYTFVATLESIKSEQLVGAPIFTPSVCVCYGQWLQHNPSVVTSNSVTVSDQNSPISATFTADNIVDWNLSFIDPLYIFRLLPAAEDTITVTDTQTKQIPVCSIGSSTKQGAAPLSVSFIAQGEDPEKSALTYSWDFGDGETAQGEQTTHIFNSAGIYIVTLLAMDNAGNRGTSTVEINVTVKNGIGKAVIIAGGGAYKGNTLFKYSTEQCQQMYGFLKQRGYTDGDIFYMTPQIWQDIDGDGRDDNVVDYQLFNPIMELDQLFSEIADALTIEDQFVLYIHGHAKYDKLIITKENEVSSEKLNQLLSKLPTRIQQIIIFDTCYSGSFMDELSGVEGRMVITSSDSFTPAWNVEYSSFSDKFIRILRQGQSVGTAFQVAEDMIINSPDLFRDQRPQLDDTGDGIYSNADGIKASQIYIGGEGIQASQPPNIINVHPRIELAENSASATLWVKTSPENEGIRQVRAVMINPGFSPSDYQGEKTQFGREELEMIYSASQKRFEVNFDGFREQGIWKIMYQAQETDGVWSDVAFGEVKAPGVDAYATISVNLNQSVYQVGDQLLFSVIINGQTSVDLYVALMFPGEFFQTIIYPLSFSMTNSIMPYQTGINLSGEQSFPILDIEIPQGTYICYGIVTDSGSDPWNAENWIHFDFKTFEMK